MTVFLLNLLTGVLLSFLAPFAGGWYFHFLPVVAVAHALLVGLVYGILRSVFTRYLSYPWTGYWVVTVLVGLYFFIWTINFSYLVTVESYSLYGTSLLVVLLALGVGELVRYGVRELLSGFSARTGVSLEILVILLLLLGKGFVVGSLPQSFVDRRVLKVNPITSAGGTVETVRRFVYPFSLPLEEGLKRYGWFLGERGKTGDHIFVVILDSLRDDTAGSTVGDLPVTPSVDELAEEGLRFNNYYVQGSWTKPSTASLFTGRYLREHGTFLAFAPGRSDESDTRFYGQELPARFQTLSERLARRDYRTFGAVSISHISSEYQFNQGYDTWFDPMETSNEIDDYAAVHRLLFWLMRRDPDRSFTYLHMTGPHYPYGVSHYNRAYWKETGFHTKRGLRVPKGELPEPKDMTTATLPVNKQDLSKEQIEYIRHLYGAKLNLWDRKIVNPLVEGLEAAGFLPGNYVFVASDHGEEIYDSRRFGHKGNLRESVISPPLIARGPGFGEGESDRMVESIDLTSTILELAGADTASLSGSSFAYPGESYDSSPALVEMGRTIRLAPGVNRDRITFEPGQLGVTVALVREGPWKQYHHYTSQRDVLINLREDPGETRRIENRPGITGRLRNRIFRDLGSDTSLKTSPPPLIRAGESEVRNLKGLGYL